MGFSRQEYWNGLPFSSPGDSTNLGIKSTSPTLAGGFFYHWATRKGPRCIYQSENNSVHSKLLQSCLTLCGHMICSPSGSSVHGIFQARILEWVAMSFSRGFSGPKDRTWVSHTAGRLFTNWTTRKAQNNEVNCHNKKKIEHPFSLPIKVSQYYKIIYAQTYLCVWINLLKMKN